MQRLQKRKRPFPDAEYPMLFGHRGCSTAAPENTMASFSKIREFEIPGVELDIQVCATGELVVIHDLNLLRTAGLDADVHDTSYEQIRELDAGSWFGDEFRGEKVPRLDDVFDLLGKDVYYDIEIKHKRKRYGKLEKSLVEKIRSRGMEDRVLVSSFNPVAVRGVRKFDSSLNTAVIYCNWEELPWFLRNGEGRYISGCNILKPTRHKINRLSMFMNKTIGGYTVFTWTEDDPEKAEEFIKLGVDGIVSNVPELLIDTVRKFKTGNL